LLTCGNGPDKDPDKTFLASQEEKMSSQMDYLDGNAAAGELSNIFAVDITAAEAKCAHCGATKRFAEAHLYMRVPASWRGAALANTYFFAL
jgi:hypothetical protein